MKFSSSILLASAVAAQIQYPSYSNYYGNYANYGLPTVNTNSVSSYYPYSIPSVASTPVAFYQDVYSKNKNLTSPVPLQTAPVVSIAAATPSANPCQWFRNTTDNSLIIQCPTINPWTGLQVLGSALTESEYQTQRQNQALLTEAQSQGCVGVPYQNSTGIVCPTYNAWGGQVYSTPMNATEFATKVAYDKVTALAQSKGCQKAAALNPDNTTDADGLICPEVNAYGWPVWGTAMLRTAFVAKYPTTDAVLKEVSQSKEQFLIRESRKAYELQWQALYTASATKQAATRTAVQEAYYKQIGYTAPNVTNPFYYPYQYSNVNSFTGYSQLPSASQYTYGNVAQYSTLPSYNSYNPYTQYSQYPQYGYGFPSNYTFGR